MRISGRQTRSFKWTAISLIGLVLILLVVYAVAIWMFGSRLERRLAAIRAAGDPISIADYHFNAIPPEKDAAKYLRRAKNDAKAMSVRLDSIVKNISERNTCLNDTEIKAIESAFADYPKVIPLLEQAANCIDYSVDLGADDAGARDITNVLIENATQRRIFARLLYHYRFFLLLSQNKHDEAVQNCITLLKLCRLIEKDPAMINFLGSGCAFRSIAFARANEVLQTGRVSDSVRQELENELAKIDIRRAFLQALKGERAFSLDCYEEMCSRMPRYSRIFFNREMLGCLDACDWMIARATAALPENVANSPAGISQTPPSGGVLGPNMLSVLQAAEKSVDRVEAEIRVIRVINALGRRGDPQKPPLADLFDLGLPKSAATDPFNGKPLVVKKVEGGWLVYSVGENKVDDGGDLEELSATGKQLDVGLRPVIRTKAAATDHPAASEPKSK